MPDYKSVYQPQDPANQPDLDDAVLASDSVPLKSRISKPKRSRLIAPLIGAALMASTAVSAAADGLRSWVSGGYQHESGAANVEAIVAMHEPDYWLLGFYGQAGISGNSRSEPINIDDIGSARLSGNLGLIGRTYLDDNIIENFVLGINAFYGIMQTSDKNNFDQYSIGLDASFRMFEAALNFYGTNSDPKEIRTEELARRICTYFENPMQGFDARLALNLSDRLQLNGGYSRWDSREGTIDGFQLGFAYALTQNLLLEGRFDFSELQNHQGALVYRFGGNGFERQNPLIRRVQREWSLPLEYSRECRDLARIIQPRDRDVPPIKQEGPGIEGGGPDQPPPQQPPNQPAPGPGIDGGTGDKP